MDLNSVGPNIQGGARNLEVTRGFLNGLIGLFIILNGIICSKRP